MVKSNLISDEELDGVSGGVLQATEHTVSVKSSNYLSFIRSASNVAVMFGASWCGPAQIMSETSERFAAKNEQTAVGFVDVDDPYNKKMADAMGITSIPVILYYKNGTLTDRTYGVVPLERMESAFL